MEGNLPPRALIPGGGGGGTAFDLVPPFHFAAPAPQPQVVQVHQGAFAPPAASQNQMQDLSNAVKASPSDEEDVDDGHRDRGKAPAAQWHRVKWTSDMVKLLVSAVAYIDDDVEADHGVRSRRRKHAMLKRKGKWKLVSAAMTERAFAVSPQQCEDKFNDLNKRYKRLTEILGRGTACQVITNPTLLDQMSLSPKLKEEARKQLNSKHLHYEEMCSYHNKNRLCLLIDPELKKSLRMALRTPDEQGKKRSLGYDDEDDQVLLSDEEEEEDEPNDDLEGSAEDSAHQRVHGAKKLKYDHGEGCCGSHLSDVAAVDMNRMLSEGSGGPSAEKTASSMHAQIERRRLKIKSDMLKIEQSHFKWMKFSKEKDRQLQQMKLENEKMELENERLELELELKLKEIEMGIKPNKI